MPHFEDKIIFYIILLISITMHEFGHAFAADKLGDPLPRSMGRVTLNPLAHADKIGTFLLPLIMIFTTSGSFLFGWGKPVYVSLPNPKTRIRDDLLSTACGPLANLVLALISTILFAFGYFYEIKPLFEVAALALQVNCVLFVFNMLPVPPLDGSHFLRYVLKVSNETYAKIERNGFWILLILIFLPQTSWVLHFLIRIVISGFSYIASLIILLLSKI